MATQNGPMTLETGRPYVFGETGWQSLHCFGKVVAGWGGINYHRKT